jgi:tetratricopeptide (TPR) repeat protein
MELLAGETLAERLSQHGKLNPGEALPVLEQVAGALTAAHRAGVIHRDLKSGNVMLVPPSNPGEPPRAVVMDFGIALGRLEAEAAKASDPDRWAGTPEYMAPEQVAGGEITPATDIYALGVVMYEMVTGMMPFTGDTARAPAVRPLTARAESPGALAPELDPRWEAAILRCLEREPAARFGSAAEVVPAITARARSRRAVAVLGFTNRSGLESEAWLSTTFAEALTAELGAGEGLRAIAGEEVSQAMRELTPAERERPGAAAFTRLNLILGADLVVTGSYQMTGPDGSRSIGWDVRLEEASGKLLAQLRETGPEAELFELVDRVAAGCFGALDLELLSPAEARRARSGLPRDPLTLRLYAEGLAKLRLSEDIAARDSFARAVVADPAFPLAHAMLAEAWWRLGYEPRAQEAAQRAFELSGNLRREDRLAIEARYRQMNRDWKRAIDLYRSLWVFFPDRLEYGLDLATVQLDAESFKEALSTVGELRALPSPLNEDPRIDFMEARAAHYLADYRRSLRVVERAAAKGRAAGARLVIAQARGLEAQSHRALGDLDRAMASTAEARQIHAEAGHRGGVAQELFNLAMFTRERGELRRAQELFQEALGVFREIGKREYVASAMNAIATLRENQGDPTAALQMLEEALVINREIGSKRGVRVVLNNLSKIHWQRGELDQARERVTESLAVAREIGSRRSEAFALNGLGLYTCDMGDLERAKRLYEEAVAIWRDIGDRINLAWALGILAQVEADLDELPAAIRLQEEVLSLLSEVGDYRMRGEALVRASGTYLRAGDLARATSLAEEALSRARTSGFQSNLAEVLNSLAMARFAAGDLAGARAHLEEALEILSAINHPAAATSRIVLAMVAQAEGRHEEAIELARLACRQLTDRKSDDAVVALAVMALAILDSGAPEEASNAMSEARSRASRSQNRYLRRAIAIANGRLQAALGRSPEAKGILDAARSEAAQAGCVDQELEARLFLGETEIASGDPAGAERLEALEREAEDRGFGHIGRRAREARIRRQA